MAPMFRASLFLAVLTITISAAAQTPGQQATTSQGPQAATNPRPRVTNPGASTAARPPDMVCFGYYPNWSVQFINGEARYLGINEPDQTFLGDFYWVAEDKVWEWHRANGLAPMNGNYGLSASVRKEACQDSVQKETFPYSSQVYLPQGDMVSGCCRKLKPGEAPVGKHGAPSTTPERPAPATGTQPGIPRTVTPPPSQ